MGVWVDGALPLLTFVLIAAAGWLRRGGYLQIRGLLLEQQNRHARTLFGRFVSRNVAAVLLESDNSQTPQQQLVNATILMSDLRGFSLITADHPPAVVVRLLNIYLESMFEVVEQFGGTIDEVIGDALLVLFGAPQPCANHAELAIACAIQMQLTMERVNRINRQQALPELAMGIGLCSGDVMAGTIGSGRRAKYAVVGSAVNLAARIEALTVGGEILAAESTICGLEAELRIDARHRWLVKGSEEPLQVVEIGAIAGACNLALPRSTALPRRLPHALRVVYQPIQAKTRQGPPREALITHLGEREAWLDPQGAELEPFDDLVLRIADHPGDVYAKVREAESATGLRIVFTTMPAALKDGLHSPTSGESPPGSP
jgi:adenylate cyclase